MPRSPARLLAIALAAGCTFSEPEPEPNHVFEGEHAGTCSFETDGYVEDWEFDLDAVYDEAKAKVSGEVTSVDHTGDILTGELSGRVDGNRITLNLVGEGEVESGYYAFDVDVDAQAVQWWYEGTCTSSGGASGTLFMR